MVGENTSAVHLVKKLIGLARNLNPKILGAEIRHAFTEHANATGTNLIVGKTFRGQVVNVLVDDFLLGIRDAFHLFVDVFGKFDLLKQVLGRKESACDVKNLTRPRHKDTLNVLPTSTLAAWSWLIVGGMGKRCASGGIALRVGVNAVETGVQIFANVIVRERHGSHSMAGTSHETFEITEYSKPENRLFVFNRLFRQYTIDRQPIDAVHRF